MSEYEIDDAIHRNIVERSDAMLSVVDAQGVFVYVNPAWTRALGWQPSELVGKAYLDFVHPDDVADTLTVAAALAGGDDVTGYTNRYRKKDGLYRNIKWWSDPSEGDYLYATAQDVTEMYRSSSRASEIEGVSGVCSWEVDVETNELYWSDGTKNLVGWTEERHPSLEEALGFYPEESLAKLEPVFGELMESGRPFTHELVHLRCDGTRFLARATGAAELRNGKVVRVYGTFENVTELREAEQAALARERELREAAVAAYDAERKALAEQAWAARHDNLTGLGNRQLLEEALEAADGQRFLIVAIDLDLFKHVNDSFGHSAGDHVLRQTAQRLRKAASGHDDQVFRIGGDEFIMLVRLDNLQVHPQALCDWLADHLAERTEYRGVNLRIGASLGYSELTEGASPRTKLRQADMALYEAKSQGRNRALGYNDSIGAAHIEKVTLAQELKLAVENKEIDIALQPQVASRTGELVGCEVLARWCHPTRGHIPPSVFIPLAEEMSLLSALDKLVLDMALEARRQLAQKGMVLPKISVNVSAKRLTSSDLLNEVTQRKDVPDNGLAFEILETSFLDTINDDVCRQIDGLRARGIFIEVDDFGTGHASFASVFALKPDVLKFDRMFVGGIETDITKREMVASLIKIAHNVGAKTLIEGVETDQQIAVLVELGVDYLQGFGVGYPMSAEEFLAWAVRHGEGMSSISA
ncbi:MAG: EAL domain-containing protein [Pseudomonadota bacterium]